ncbi:MAG TPA: DNA polymerase III subunit delta' [Pirellulales bacterium]|nr:DNA polymerase III subunit delta' [Pirellulales bacterium]
MAGSVSWYLLTVEIMAWQGIEGHDAVVSQFRRSLARDRLASTFLFVGPSGIGKRAFAEKLAQTLLCLQTPAEDLAPCGKCPACLQAAAHTHPDLHIVEKPAERSSIPLSLFIGDDAHRMREGLCHDIALRPFMGGRKVAIIDDADYLNEESANCLLKTLEEPPPRSVLILIGTTADAQLPTIRSRSQIVRFRPLEQAIVAQILEARGLASDRQQALRLAEFSNGSVERALELADDELWTFRRELLSRLSVAPLTSVTLARELNALVEAAGKDAAVRRTRARQIVAFAVEFYRQRLRAQTGLKPQGDDDLCGAVRRGVANTATAARASLAAVERSIEALAHIDRNAHQATLLECWLDDLARIEQGGHPVASYGDS